MSIFSRLFGRRDISLPPRVIHWISQAPTFTLLDTNEEALEIAHSLDAIVQGREHLQAHILILRDRVAQDTARIAELEALINQVSAHNLNREADVLEEARRETRTAVTEAAKAYVSTAQEPIKPRPGSETNGSKGKLNLAEAGEAMVRAMRS